MESRGDLIILGKYDTNARRWYANHLTEAIYHARITYLHPVTLPLHRPQLEIPGTGTITIPALIEAYAPPRPQANIPEAQLTMGLTNYHEAVVSLTDDQRLGWAHYLSVPAVIRDIPRHPFPLFQARGRRVLLSEPQTPWMLHAQFAAEHIVLFALVTKSLDKTDPEKAY